MASAKEITRSVFKNGSAVFMARVVGSNGVAIKQADLSTAKYSVYLVAPGTDDEDVVVANHDAVALTVSATIFDTLQTTDQAWILAGGDATGYNLRYEIDVSTTQAFTVADRYYRVIITLTPVSGQSILVRFKVKVT
jgi:hypothetical protein